MTITALPIPPSRQDPINFSERADAFMGALPAFATETNATAVGVDADAVSAAASAVNAAASAAGANASANVSKWVSGTTYAEGDVEWSPVNFFSYRRKVAGAGTTDPSADPTNWALVSGGGDVSLTGVQTLTNKTLVAPALGTPASGTLTNCTFPVLNQNTTGNAETVTNGVYTTGNQTIGGTKTFSSSIVGSVTGNAATATTDTQHFGIGQSWQNVGGNRALGTVYTNTTGKAIQLFVRTSGSNTAAAQYITVTINGASVVLMVSYFNSGHVYHIIPPGTTYSIQIDIGTLTSWWELR